MKTYIFLIFICFIFQFASLFAQSETVLFDRAKAFSDNAQIQQETIIRKNDPEAANYFASFRKFVALRAKLEKIVFISKLCTSPDTLHLDDPMKWTSPMTKKDYDTFKKYDNDFAQLATQYEEMMLSLEKQKNLWKRINRITAQHKTEIDAIDSNINDQIDAIQKQMNIQRNKSSYSTPPVSMYNNSLVPVEELGH